MSDAFPPSDPQKDGDALQSLLLRWLALCAGGQDLTAEELCRDRPDLLVEVRARLEALRAVHAVLDTAPSPAVAAAPPQIPGYEVLGELGRGGMGVVYKARHKALGRLVALKVLLAGSFAGEAALARFRREAEVVARLNHPNVVQIYEVGEHAGCPFLALELMEGGSLADRLGGAAREPAWAAELVEVLAQALAHAHARGVLHRDLKPGNVLLAADDTPKIGDFGLARKFDPASPGRTSGENLTDTGAVLGTPSYMAPEQAAGRADLGPAADVWALGAVLYELLTGRPPFEAATPIDIVLQVLERDPTPPRTRNARVPRDLDVICLKCLEKEPARRYASALDLAEDLRRFRAGEAIRARPVGPIGRAWRWGQRRPLAVGLLAALVVALLAGGTALVLLRTMHAKDKASAQTAFDRGIALLRLNETTEAETAFTEAIRLDPAHAGAHAYRAWTSIGRRQYDKGLAGCEEALRLDPLNYNALRFRAIIHTEQGRHDEAVRDTTEILRLGGDPQAHGPYVIRSHAYVLLGQWDRAAEDFEQACAHTHARDATAASVSPASVDAFRAGCRLGAGDVAGYRRACADLLQRFGETADTDCETAYLLARVFALAPDSGIAPARTVQLAEQALRGKTTAWYQHTLGLAYFRAGQSALGLQRLQESIAGGVITWDGTAVNQLALALLLHQHGDTVAARSWLDKATSQPPRVIHPHETMAYQLLRREAEAAVEKPR